MVLSVVLEARQRMAFPGETPDEKRCWMISIVVRTDEGMRFVFDIFTPVVIGYRRLLEFAQCREGDSMSFGQELRIQIENPNMRFISSSYGYDEVTESYMSLHVPAHLVAEKLTSLVEAMEKRGYFGEQRTRTYGNPLPTPIRASKRDIRKLDMDIPPIMTTASLAGVVSRPAAKTSNADRHHPYQNFATLRF